MFIEPIKFAPIEFAKLCTILFNDGNHEPQIVSRAEYNERLNANSTSDRTAATTQWLGLDVAIVYVDGTHQIFITKGN